MNRTKQPNSDWCFVCGRKNSTGLQMTFFDNGSDEVTSEYRVPERFQSYPGIVHGGVLASILDEVVARVSMIGDPDHLMVTVRLEVAYRQAVPIETPLKAFGRIVKLRGRLGRAEGKILLPDGTVACEAQMKLADIPTDIFSDENREHLGWRVDP